MADNYPQLLRGTVVESAANTYTEAQIPTQVQVNQVGSKSTVLNILRISVETSNGALGDDDQILWHVADRSHSDIQDIDVAGVYAGDSTNSQVNTTGAFIRNTRASHWYFSDGASHGVLFGGPTIFLAVKGSSQASAQNARLQILYTFVSVSANELLGIINPTA